MQKALGPVLAVVLCSSLTLLGGFWIKNDCTYADWGDWYQYRHYCYSDILPLYGIRHLDRDALPYLEEFSEYPVLTGFVTWVAAYMTEGLHAYLLLTFGLLMLCGFIVTVVHWRLKLPLAYQLAWAASPALIIHSYTNWDLVAVAFAAGGWLRWRQGYAFQSAVLFGLGGAAKLYGAFFLPFLFFATVFERNWKRTTDVVLGGVIGFGIPNAVVWYYAPENWWRIWKFHAERHPDFETPWDAGVLQLLKEWWPNGNWDRLEVREQFRDFVGWVGVLSMAAVLLWFAYRQWKIREDALYAGGLLTLVFLLANRVYSPQYTLWVVPILVALRAPLLPLWGFAAADLANFWVRYRLFTPPDGQTQGWNDEWLPWSRAFVLLRWGFLVWCVIGILVRHRRERRQQEREGPSRSGRTALDVAREE